MRHLPPISAAAGLLIAVFSLTRSAVALPLLALTPVAGTRARRSSPALRVAVTAAMVI